MNGKVLFLVGILVVGLVEIAIAYVQNGDMNERPDSSSSCNLAGRGQPVCAYYVNFKPDSNVTTLIPATLPNYGCANSLLPKKMWLFCHFGPCNFKEMRLCYSDS